MQRLFLNFAVDSAGEAEIVKLVRRRHVLFFLP